MQVLVRARAMIPTSYKGRLAKDLSWAINALLLSEALEGVPQYEELTVWFSTWSTLRKSEFRKQIEDKLVISVLDMSYRNNREDRWTARDLAEKDRWTARCMAERGDCGESWRITVYPVPRNQKALVRDAILSSGVAAIREWLTKQRPPSWYEGRKSISLGFDLDKQVLIKNISED